MGRAYHGTQRRRRVPVLTAHRHQMTMVAITAAGPNADAPAIRLCAHCGQPLGRDDGRFCCGGCAGAYRLIRDLHLDRYYAGRTLDHAARLPKPPEEAPDVAAYAVAAQDGTSSLGLMIDGLHCSACVWLIETALQRQPQVIEARVNLTTRRLRLRWRGSVEDGIRLADLVRRLGYRVIAYDPQKVAQLASQEETRLLR